MGLDMTHGAWRSSYSGFDEYRRHLADVADLGDLGMIWGKYSDRLPREVLDGDWSGVGADEIEEMGDPLLFLLCHSDCDGTIQPAQAVPLADRLEELLPRISDMKPYVLTLREHLRDLVWKVGYLDVDESVRDHLLEIENDMPDDRPRVPTYREMTTQLVNGLRSAAALEEPVVFH